MSKDHEILADRLNAEPVIFKGCSSSELGMIVGLAIVIWLPSVCSSPGYSAPSPWVSVLPVSAWSPPSW